MGKGLDYDELFPGRFLKSGLFKGRDVTLTIKGVRTESLPQEKGGEKVKGVLSFVERPLELVLNRTNGECIKAMFGRDTGDWVGKRITFWPAPFTDSFTGEVGTAIRVRGSPDISTSKPVEIRLPRKKPFTMTLVSTGKTTEKIAPARQPEESPTGDDQMPF